MGHMGILLIYPPKLYLYSVYLRRAIGSEGLRPNQDLFSSLLYSDCPITARMPVARGGPWQLWAMPTEEAARLYVLVGNVPRKAEILEGQRYSMFW